jgi:multidrug transporter EmrE-like cation transporter
VKLSSATETDSAPARERIFLPVSIFAVLLATPFFLWPSVYNGFPLLMADSMTYLADGLPVARAVLLHRFSEYYGMRSLLYSLSIFPFHWNVNPWPVIVFQSLATAWVLWLVVRAFSTRQTVRRYLALAALLSLFTSIAWFTCFLMPDILGPLAYLAMFLLFFARESLSRVDRAGLGLVACWGITAHSTHLLLAAALFVLLALCALFERRTFRRNVPALGDIAAALTLAVLSQVALYAYLDGKPSLNGLRPPYLTARVIADGPGRWYLDSHCATEHWAACGHLANLPSDADSFLWGDNAPYQTASEDEQSQFEEQDARFFLATIRAYPREQLQRSAANFGQQLVTFGLHDFHSSEWTLAQFNEVIPGYRASYVRSREAHDALPLDNLTAVQFWTLILALVVIAGLTLLRWRRQPRGLLGLALVVFSMVVLNAFLTGTLAVVDDRYQCRVAWLVPLLAGVSVLDWLEHRTAGQGLFARKPH